MFLPHRLFLFKLFQNGILVTMQACRFSQGLCMECFEAYGGNYESLNMTGEAMTGA